MIELGCRCASCRRYRGETEAYLGDLILTSVDPPVYVFANCLPCVCGETRIVLRVAEGFDPSIAYAAQVD